MIGMKEYPDKYFELAIVDPPYGKNADLGTNGFGSAKNRRYKSKWDSAIPDKDYFSELFRTSKNQIIWGANYFITFLAGTNCFIVWDKKGDITFENPFADVELAWTSFNSVSKKVTIIQQGFLNSNDVVIHPTQKPIALYKWLLTKYAKPNDKILDTHVGSASSLIACEDMGFEYVGFELDKDYYLAAQKRLENFRKQLKLAI